MRPVMIAALVGGILTIALGAEAQQQPADPITQPVPEAMPNYIPYGEPIRLAEARKVLSKALTEADKHNWKLACAVVEPSGDLVAFEKMDDTQYASIQIAQDKAQAAARFRRSTKVFFDTVKGGNAAPLGLRGTVASEGGWPIQRNGKMTGAIGCSGGASNQDAVAARAGAE